MRPLADITSEHLAYWADLNPRVKTFAAPEGLADCEPCRAVVTCEMEPGDDGLSVGPPIVRTPWQLDDEEIARLVQGGTLWLSTWGGLPPHMLEVQAPDDADVIPTRERLRDALAMVVADIGVIGRSESQLMAAAQLLAYRLRESHQPDGGHADESVSDGAVTDPERRS